MNEPQHKLKQKIKLIDMTGGDDVGFIMKAQKR